MYTVLKKIEREKKNLARPTTSSTAEMLPSPNEQQSGEKDDRLRHQNNALRRTAAAEQQNNSRKDSNVRKDVVGP